ncbi:MAG TPA: hemerythrin domain-containing protein [Candidatus Sulfotelmatobacter sp.]|nr:hemerythrin domain-containing protein [Candidatus Sulfotelmatobacter sp.]
MPVQIGAKAHHFTDPTGLLSDCHRRIEMFLGTLEAVAAMIDRPLTEDTARALESALLYFSQAAPKHTADEEESLFPRLRQMRDPEIVAVFSRIEKLEEEHRVATELHNAVERLGTLSLSRGNLSDIEIEEFRSSVARLAAIYKQHISIEDKLIFPLASRMLSYSEKQNVANEMAGRRKVRLITDLTGSRT